MQKLLWSLELKSTTEVQSMIKNSQQERGASACWLLEAKCFLTLQNNYCKHTDTCIPI
jgi:hypothetical protein